MPPRERTTGERLSNLCDIGVDPRCWYPACRSDELGPGQAREVRFLGRSFVVFRDGQGAVHCLDNACAHRRVALHEGEVRDCRIVCPYHGWEYGPDGALARIPYWEEEAPLPRLRVRSFPVAERSGLVWFVPEPADPLPPQPPDTSRWDGGEWFSFRQDRVFPNHYGVGLINGMDYTHFHLHRKYQPWSRLRLRDLETDEQRVFGAYEVTSGHSRAERTLRMLLGSDRNASTVTYPLEVYYDYPHHQARLGDGMVVWAFFRPEGRDRVAVYITLYIKARRGTRRLRQFAEPFFRRLVLARIQEQDAWIGVREQIAWETRPDEPRCELNPVAAAAERLLRSRWQAYVEEAGPPDDRWPGVRLTHGAAR
ncbi:Rieske (2Fe-2S) protein [Microbispora triticiradicis]|uniref:Rieske (2Fe-2S) protein n=3 Tax=Microbispora TaxID=2005 RepID=A0ABY3LNW5_9ACTN|nr:Rieske (2Fe-2S) protein [Microbispora triticiradicis]TLP58640.1 Rieske (2Fe-2S) protein [Microbispora fusca]TYB45158.1 Rieske (2Fe-2S) protein [Microbispora tritici]